MIQINPDCEENAKNFRFIKGKEKMLFEFTHKTFKAGDNVKKIKGSQWHGKVVGFYSTYLTPEGYCVESNTEKGSVQLYPVSALERE